MKHLSLFDRLLWDSVVGFFCFFSLFVILLLFSTECLRFLPSKEGCSFSFTFTFCWYMDSMHFKTRHTKTLKRSNTQSTHQHVCFFLLLSCRCRVQSVWFSSFRWYNPSKGWCTCVCACVVWFAELVLLLASYISVF